MDGRSGKMKKEMLWRNIGREEQTMSESQNIEYKESWRDEYLKWICGFANAQGGSIFIGIDDSGNVVGVKDCKKLMEDIPNKIQAGLGLLRMLIRNLRAVLY